MTLAAEARCPGCNRSLAPTSDSAPLVRADDVRDQVLARTFAVEVCPSCERRVVLEGPYLYFDLERRHWIGVYPLHQLPNHAALDRETRAVFDDTMRTGCAPIVRTWVAHFSIRAVFGLEALREKLVCFDEGLNDRALETLKLMLIRDGALGPISPLTPIHLDRVEHDHLILFHGSMMANEHDQAQPVAVPLTAYDEVWAGLPPALDDETTSCAVDWRTLVIGRSEASS